MFLERSMPGCQQNMSKNSHSPQIAPRYRLPVQKRSRERFGRLLDAAAEILAEGGYDALTTNRVAEAAGIPIGSLYQFFPDKQALVEALSERYSVAIRELCEETLTVDLARRDLIEFVGELIEGISRIQTRNAGFLCVFSGDSTSGPYGGLARALRGTMAHHLDRVLAEAYPEVPQGQRRLVLKTMADASAAMISSLGLEKERERPIVVDEMKTMLGLYVAARFGKVEKPRT
jgi:AcrR family transcriptional regulator